jgi:hypothetical protein
VARRRRTDARRVSAVLSGERGCRPFPRPLSPPAVARLRFAPDGSLDEVQHFAENQKASVATLRWCSASARNTVRLPFGKAFAFAGIRKFRQNVAFPLADASGITCNTSQCSTIFPFESRRKMSIPA